MIMLGNALQRARTVPFHGTAEPYLQLTCLQPPPSPVQILYLHRGHPKNRHHTKLLLSDTYKPKNPSSHGADAEGRPMHNAAPSLDCPRRRAPAEEVAVHNPQRATRPPCIRSGVPGTDGSATSPPSLSSRLTTTAIAKAFHSLRSQPPSSAAATRSLNVLL